MSILDVLRVGVGIADSVTKPLQSTVLYHRYVSSGVSGDVAYATAVPLHAIEDWTSVQVRTREGTLSVTRAVLSLLNVKEVVDATGGDGIDDKDQFTLADGTRMSILDLGGFVDAGTTHPVATDVKLG